MLKEYKETGLPFLPDKAVVPVKGRFKYPFADLTVGDYFLVVLQDAAHSAWVSAQHHAKVNPGKKFVKVRVDDGWRIYRTA